MKYWKENGMKIGIKDKKDMSAMRESGRILGIILSEIERMIMPGVNCLELDQKAAEMMKEFNVKASFKGYQGFPKTTCINVNDEVVHGIPNDRILKEGDIITVDCGVIYKGFHSDSAISVGVGTISEDARKLLNTAEKALKKAIETARPGIRVQAISGVIEDIVEKNGFAVVRDLVGHGIGTNMHEDPPIPNFRDEDHGPMLQAGMTIAIEPIITNGSPKIRLGSDNWTYKTIDGSLATQVEHTIAITEKGSEILTKRPILEA